MRSTIRSTASIPCLCICPVWCRTCTSRAGRRAPADPTSPSRLHHRRCARSHRRPRPSCRRGAACHRSPSRVAQPPQRVTWTRWPGNHDEVRVQDYVRHRRIRRFAPARPRSRPTTRRRACARCASVIRHRGPDDEGVRVDAGCGARHAPPEHHRPRRRPPADRQRGRHRLDRVQRRDLQLPRACAPSWRRPGHRFATSTDTEVIVHAYEQWGRDAFARLARHVRPRALGLPARARCCSRATASGSSRSTTPMHGGRLCFGSELKSLLARRAVGRAIDPDALDHYLAFLYTPRRIAHLPGRLASSRPATCSRWRDGRAARASATGRPDRAKTLAGIRSGTPWRTLLTRVLRDAVRSHLVSDVPLGAFLSGGVDSSLVVALMAAGLGRPREDLLDRLRRAGLRRARARAPRWRSTSAPTTTSSWSGPTRSAIRRRLGRALRRAVRRRVGHSRPGTSRRSPGGTSRSVLSGDGGDELFAGYDRYVPHPRVARLRSLRAAGPRQVAASPADRLPHGAAARLPRARRAGRAGPLSRGDRVLQLGREPALLAAMCGAASGGREPEDAPRPHFERLRRAAAGQPDDALRLSRPICPTTC